MRLRHRVVRGQISAVLFATAAFGAAGPARAAVCAPPGTAGVGEYVESIPGASCNLTVPAGHRAQRTGALPAGTRAALLGHGQVGRAVVAAVEATAPAELTARRSGTRRRGIRRDGPAPAGGGSPPPNSGTPARPTSGGLSGPSGPGYLAALLGSIAADGRAGGSGVLLVLMFLAIIGVAAAPSVGRAGRDAVSSASGGRWRRQSRSATGSSAGPSD